jgi:acetyl-CoA C-acetyltransferase
MTRPLPVLVGAGQITDRPADPREGLEPLALMEAAARRAFDDAAMGAAALAAVDTVAVVTNVFHDYGDTARMLARRLGLQPARTILSTWGGNTPQSLLSHLCDEIAAGRAEVALLAGAEAFQTMRALGKAGIPSPWTPPSARAVPRWGEARPGVTELEARHGAREAYVSFALFENAFRAARGQSLEAQRSELGTFGERCARIAAENPYAWFRDAKDAATLTSVTPSNRMVAFPYPKYLNAIMEVNQGAALLVASATAARRLGVPEDRLVYPWAAVDVAELWFLSDRANFHELPGMRRAAHELLASIELNLDQVRHLDLYGCFPIAPRLSAAMLGLDPAAPRPLTVTGALPWFGGPGNDYATHAIAAMMARLRTERDTFGLVHALGWNFTKHALAVYSASPPPRGWQRAGGETLQAWVESQLRPVVATDPSGPGMLETYTVVHGRDGVPERGVAVGRLDDGRRFVATLPKDGALLQAFEDAEQVGRRGTVRPAGGLTLFDPS